MNYSLCVRKEVFDRIRYYFDGAPFSMQAAFALIPAEGQSDAGRLFLDEFIELGEADYKSRAHDSMSFYSRVLLDILKKTSYRDRLSLIYMHSHRSIKETDQEADDQALIFGISYAYIPYGLHASLYYAQDGIKGNIWLPSLSTLPLDICIE